MARLSKELHEAVSALSLAEQKLLVGYVRILKPVSAERKTPKPVKKKRIKKIKQLEDSKIGKLILKLEAKGDIGLPEDFASQVDHYAYGTPKRRS